MRWQSARLSLSLRTYGAKLLRGWSRWQWAASVSGVLYLDVRYTLDWCLPPLFLLRRLVTFCYKAERQCLLYWSLLSMVSIGCRLGLGIARKHLPNIGEWSAYERQAASSLIVEQVCAVQSGQSYGVLDSTIGTSVHSYTIAFVSVDYNGDDSPRYYLSAWCS